MHYIKTCSLVHRILVVILLFNLSNINSLAHSTISQNAISPSIALQRLIDGNERYMKNISENRDFSVDRVARANAQYPIAAILSCSDSRVVPEIAFDQSLGDLFLVRVAGNFVNEDGLASIEYATEILNVPLVIVLGHSNCGAVKAAIKVEKESIELPGHLPQLIKTITPAIRIAQRKASKHSKQSLLESATIENVKLNVQYLMKAQPLLIKSVKSGKIKVVGAIYEIKTGKVRFI